MNTYADGMAGVEQGALGDAETSGQVMKIVITVPLYGTEDE